MAASSALQNIITPERTLNNSVLEYLVDIRSDAWVNIFRE
jgi:hypothetical protein